MSPRKNPYKKQACVPAAVKGRWIPATSAKAKSFLPKLELRSLNASAEQKSILSHWAQTLGTPFSKPFESAALEILEGSKNAESFADAPPQILFPELFDVPFPPPEKPKFTFIDLFADFPTKHSRSQESAASLEKYHCENADFSFPSLKKVFHELPKLDKRTDNRCSKRLL